MTHEPAGHADEKSMLKGWLDLYRDVMVMKTEGLSDEQARFRPTEHANSLLNLIFHLAGVERNWFQNVIAGRPIDRNRDAQFRELDLSLAEAVALYRKEWATSNEIIAGVTSLDDACAGESGYSVRWVLHHMLEETARHAGHADITRELIDGVTGWTRSDPG